MSAPQSAKYWSWYWGDTISREVLLALLAFIVLILVILFLASASPGEQVQTAAPRPVTSQESAQASTESATSDISEALTGLDEIDQILGE